MSYRPTIERERSVPDGSQTSRAGQETPRMSEDLRAALQSVGTSTLGHRRDRGFITSLQPIRRPIRTAGNALTVQIGEYDSGALRSAIQLLMPGDVLVVSQPGSGRRAAIGGIMARRIQATGAAGIIVGGAITDYDQVLELGIPIWFTAVTPLTCRRLGEEGEVSIPVAIDGTAILPGDVLFGDSDGIAVLRPEEAEQIVEELKERERREEMMLQRLASGKDEGGSDGAK